MQFQLLIIVFFLLFGCRPTVRQEPTKYQRITIDSKVLGEERDLLISLPVDEFTHLYGPAQYPIIFVLDGESMFDLVASIVNFLSMKKRNALLPRSIVVGIPNTQRSRDLTPGPIEGEPLSGGGDHFLDFLAQEVIPLIEATYPTATHRTLIGHSYGGLFTLHTFFDRPGLFDNYIALDPSYQYLEDRNFVLRSDQFSEKQLFIGIAHTLEPGESPERFSKTANSRHFEELMQLTRRVEQDSFKQFEFEYAYYPDDDHASICVAATNDALRAQFSWYDFDEKRLEGSPSVQQAVDQ